MNRQVVKSVLLFFFLICSNWLFSQTQTASISVTYKKNKAELSRAEYSKLFNFVDSLKSSDKITMVIKGFTDSDADSTYNYQLSLKRCLDVKGYFVNRSIDSKRIVVIPMGEELSFSEGEAEDLKFQNRRVDVLLINQKVIAVVEPEKKKDKCNQDTTILLSHGVLATVNKCQYLKSKECLTFTTERDWSYSLKVNRLKRKLGFRNFYKLKRRTARYKICYTCKDSSCVDLVTTLYVPMTDVKQNTFSVSKYRDNKVIMQYGDSKIKAIKKKRYISIPKVSCGTSRSGNCFSIMCGGVYNACSCKPAVIKFKDGIKIIDCTAAKSYLGLTEIKISEDKSKLIVNPETPIGSITLLVGSDTVRINEGFEIQVLNHGIRRQKRCNRDSWFLFVPYKSRCNTYKKYKFRKKDIILQQEKPWTKDL